MTDSGYLHPLYAQSLTEFGEPVELPNSGGWILKRPIHKMPQFDGMGCYPIFACRDWSNLGKDLDWVSNQLVSLLMVTDPFGKYTQQELLGYFKDVAKPFKQHFVVNLQQRPEEFVDSHHQRKAHKALKMVKVEICKEPIQFLDDWVILYNHLISRHDINGVAKFSRAAFAKQLCVPGIVAFRAVFDNQTIGMLLWYVQDEVAYYHLGAYSPEGYQNKASFAMFWTLLDYFTQRGLHWLSLGAGAGVHGDQDDGLTRFKRGWATGTRTAFFCGRIFNHRIYQEIVSARNIGDTDHFPAYRANEST